MSALDLFNLGLSNNDTTVYETLVKEGNLSIRKISEITKINRGTVYDCIKHLKDLGLVSFQQKNVHKKYFAEDPNKIYDLINQKRDILDNLEEEAKKAIPNIVSKAAYLPHGNIKFYEDDEGVAVILRGVLDTVSKLKKKEYYSISSKPMREYLYRNFPNFTRQRVLKKIYVKVIAIGSGGDTVKIASRKYLNANDDKHPSSYTIIYGKKLAMIGLNDNLNPYGIVIEDEGLVDMQKLQFDQIWQSLD